MSRKIHFKKNKGLPGKSYVYLLSLDNLIKNALSFIVENNFFDLFVSSKVTWKYKYPTREKSVNSFLNYLGCYYSDRVDFLINSNFVSRSDLIIYLNQINKLLEFYQSVISQKDKELSEEDYKVLALLLQFKTKNFNWSMVNSFSEVVEEIKLVYDTLISNFIDYIRKGLMQRRKGVKDPKSLSTDAYKALVLMVDNYNTDRSRIPFNNYLKYFIKDTKSKIIKEETWGLTAGKLVGIDNLLKDKDVEQVDEGRTKKVEQDIDNNPFSYNSKPKLLAEVRAEEDQKEILNKLSTVLPKPFYAMLAVSFQLIDPLETYEELLLFSNNEGNKR